MVVPELVILLPAKNEEEGLGEVIERIPVNEIEEMGFSPRIVVVDGFSTDSTCKIAEDMGAELIRQKSDPGKGWGFREAIQVLFNGREPTDELLIMLDADATYKPEDIPRFIEELGRSDVVWGSRIKGDIEERAMSRTNLFGNKMLSLWASLLFWNRTSDLCTGFWGFKLSALKRLKLSATGFNLEAELFGTVSKSRMKTKEIPIDYAHREGQSSLKWYIDGPRIFFTSMKKRFEYTRKPIHDLAYVSAFAILVWAAIS